MKKVKTTQATTRARLKVSIVARGGGWRSAKMSNSSGTGRGLQAGAEDYVVGGRGGC